MGFVLQHRVDLRGMAQPFGGAALSDGDVMVRKLRGSGYAQNVPIFRMAWGNLAEQRPNGQRADLQPRRRIAA